MSRPVIIDTDGGVDDAAALWWAVSEPELDVIAVTVVWGNIPVERALLSVGRVLAAAGRSDIPVARGAAGPVGPAPTLRPATFIHGEDGLGNTTDGKPPPAMTLAPESAPDLIRRLCAERPGQVSLLTIGPLSNLGLVLVEDPEFASGVRELVIMGGSARAGGNALPSSEANIAHDPLAAARVASAPWSRPPLLVGLDVTRLATLTDAHFALLGEHRTAAAEFLDAPLRFYRQFGSVLTAPHTPCHDLLATMALAQPDLIDDAPVLPMAVDAAGGPAWGTTVVDFRAPAVARVRGSEQDRLPGFGPWRIGLGVDVARFRSQAAALFGG
ncbi:MAG: nucleoside hydrolase [Actinomycetota bacterium]|nr:nucleoside hydrolase [Actinomycetota bacterium]MDQ6946796.1 nucleoside hydrolase [Actinomycetota bacterium]